MAHASARVSISINFSTLGEASVGLRVGNVDAAGNADAEKRSVTDQITALTRDEERNRQNNQRYDADHMRRPEG